MDTKELEKSLNMINESIVSLMDLRRTLLYELHKGKPVAGINPECTLKNLVNQNGQD